MRSFTPYFLSFYQTDEVTYLVSNVFLVFFPLIVRRNYHPFWNHELKPFTIVFFNYSHSLRSTPEGVRLNVQNQEHNGLLTQNIEVGGLCLDLIF